MTFDNALIRKFYPNFSKTLTQPPRKKRNIHQQLEEKPDEFLDESDGACPAAWLCIDSDQSVVYKSDLLGLSTPSLTTELKNEVPVKKEKKMKMKSNTVFQISLRDSVLSFASADKACEYVFQIRNKSSNFCYHMSPGPFMQIRHQYDTSRDFQTIMLDVAGVSWELHLDESQCDGVGGDISLQTESFRRDGE